MRECPNCKKASPKTSWKITIGDMHEEVDLQEINPDCEQSEIVHVHYRVRYGECPYCHEKIEVYKDQFYINHLI